MRKTITILSLALFVLACNNSSNERLGQSTSKRVLLTSEDVSSGHYHTKHLDIFGKYTSGYNLQVLKAIDKVQALAMDGGGYFIGVTANPPESPIGYKLSLFNKALLNPPRKTSYCSGSTYSVLIESLNMILDNKLSRLDESRLESMRMQETDGGRREDGVKFWGKWNADGFGNHFALVQYSGMGKVIPPEDAQPGDFLNISWKNGGGHSTVFLGWYVNDNREKCVVYWSSQSRTNGMGDEIVPISKIKDVMFVRLTNPERLFSFDVNKKVNYSVKGYAINW